MLRTARVFQLDKHPPAYIPYHTVSPRRRYSFWIDDRQSDGLKKVKERDGVLESEQIRRAIDEWLVRKGVTDKADPRRALTRRKA
jgi:hypothetical protein